MGGGALNSEAPSASLPAGGTHCPVKRREAGEDLPGRIRDRVAEAMQISKTKLANLSAIKNGIKVPGIMRSWERDEIPEAAALEIARLPVEAQYRLLDWVIDGHSYSMRDVKQFAVMWGGCRKECPETGGVYGYGRYGYGYGYGYGYRKYAQKQEEGEVL